MCKTNDSSDQDYEPDTRTYAEYMADEYAQSSWAEVDDDLEEQVERATFNPDKY